MKKDQKWVCFGNGSYKNAKLGYENLCSYSVETLTEIKFTRLPIFVKNPETSQFLFFLAHILAYMVFVYLVLEVRSHP
jgi:hypothetical protein